MSLPNKENAFVENNKITKYLLNIEHEKGGSKARFFLKFGFSYENIEEYRAALLKHATDRDVDTYKEDEFGKMYTLVCDLETPDKRNPCIRTVWIVNKGDVKPRLVTAYPEN